MNRIITSSLQGLQYFLAHLPAAHDDWLWAQLEPLLQAPAFWKLAGGASPVRYGSHYRDRASATDALLTDRSSSKNKYLLK